jgi:hypothetical protein
LSKTGADYRQRAEEPLNRGLDFKNRKTAARDDEAGKSGELNGVAQALFRVEKNPLARERLAAPARAGECAWNPVNFAELPTGFISRPAATPFAETKLGEREVVFCACIFGVDFGGSPVSLKSLSDAAHLKERVAAIGSGAHAAKRFSAIELGNGFGESALVVENDSELIHGFSVIGIDGQCKASELAGAGHVARGELKLTPCDEGLNLRRIKSECPLETFTRKGEVPALAFEGGQVDVAGD